MSFLPGHLIKSRKSRIWGIKSIKTGMKMILESYRTLILTWNMESTNTQEK